ncbi:UNVERIFIED_CONTAM: DNA-repair protein XRCC1 [Sesamum latifolium]|uniref:DNA-repair protein XRCC1 n=1 Tax=Sesamum latifolium TaxID=2727402 RepID=A0AAW2UDT9_9LAMI
MSVSNARKRNLPSWMSSREEENDDGEKSKQPRTHGKSKKDQKAFHVESKVEENSASGSATSSGASDFSKLMEGVVFVLSGFVNPERGDLRSQMLEMGAEYQPDWTPNCTLLVCAFANTPKFRQVKADGGTVISKMKGCFSPAKVKKWAVEDLKRTISWLENQDEKPEPSEIKKIASEGILTCLQDAIDALKQGLGIQQITEQWACLPRVVEQLAQLDGTALPSKDDLCREVMVCKQIYELEFLNLEHDDIVEKKRPQTQRSKKVGNTKENVAGDDTSYDSDGTVEMTEEEIDQAYNTIACSL